MMLTRASARSTLRAVCLHRRPGVESTGMGCACYAMTQSKQRTQTCGTWPPAACVLLPLPDAVACACTSVDGCADGTSAGEGGASSKLTSRMASVTSGSILIEIDNAHF